MWFDVKKWELYYIICIMCTEFTCTFSNSKYFIIAMYLCKCMHKYIYASTGLFIYIYTCLPQIEINKKHVILCFRRTLLIFYSFNLFPCWYLYKFVMIYYWFKRLCFSHFNNCLSILNCGITGCTSRELSFKY